MATPVPSAKVNMDPNFENRYRDMQQHAQAEYEARPTGNRTLWFRPENFDGDLTDLTNLGDSFTRKQANEEGVDAVKDPEAPGVTGDTVAAVTMVEALSVLERAFRVRHTMRRPRAVAHVLSRLKGHGDATGPYIQNGVEYIRAVMAQARKPQA